MLDNIFLAAMGFVLSIGISIITVPWIMKASIEKGLVVIDAHKSHHPNIPEPGGLGLLLALLFSLQVVILIMTTLDPNFAVPLDLIAGLLSVTIAGIIGFLDDIYRIRWRHKILLGFLPAFPLMTLSIGTSTIEVPFIGPLDFAQIIPGFNLYSWVIIPLAVNFAFNSFNMFAGYNGLEAGNGTISMIFLLIIAILINNLPMLLFTTTTLGALLILLYYNWYPARTFIGDSGTLTLGTALIVAIIIGNVDRMAPGIFFLHFINFLMFFIYVKSGTKEKIGTVDEQGYLKVPCPWTLYWLLPYFFKLKEKQTVLILLSIHFVIILLVFLINLPTFT